MSSGHLSPLPFSSVVSNLTSVTSQSRMTAPLASVFQGLDGEGRLGQRWAERHTSLVSHLFFFFPFKNSFLEAPSWLPKMVGNVIF